MEIKVYDREDKLLAEFSDWKYAEVFVQAMREHIDVYVDVPSGFFEYPKES